MAISSTGHGPSPLPRFEVLPAEIEWLKLSWSCWLDSMIEGMFPEQPNGRRLHAVLIEGMAAGVGRFSRELDGAPMDSPWPQPALAERNTARWIQVDRIARTALAQARALYSGQFSSVAPTAAGTAIIASALSALLPRIDDHGPVRDAARDTFLLELNDARG